MSVSEVQKGRRAHIAVAAFIGDCENTRVPRNPDFTAPEGPILICLRACGSFQRNALYSGIGLVTLTREA
jgi:hypothetical protein